MTTHTERDEKDRCRSEEIEVFLDSVVFTKDFMKSCSFPIRAFGTWEKTEEMKSLQDVMRDVCDL